MKEQDGRQGQLFVYKDSDDVTKACMVGYDVSQLEYDLMPEYLQEHFDRPSDEQDKELGKKAPSVFVLPKEAVKEIEEGMTNAETTS